MVSDRGARIFALVVGVTLIVVVEGQLGSVQGVDACGVAAVEEHLGDQLDDLLFSPAVVERKFAVETRI